MLTIDKERSVLKVSSIRDGRFILIRGDKAEYCFPEESSGQIYQKEIPV